MAHKFKIGDRVVVTGGGIRNGWQAVVVPSFNWQKEVGAYKPVPSGYVYLRAVSDRYGEPTDAAKAYGDFNLYVGNDGMIDGSEG